MNERVSVIIPCYKQGHLLPRALQSLAYQNHPDLEVIVIDDGSPDPVVLPAAEFPFEVELIRVANRGLSGARNVGLSYATGDWIKFLDADDALLPDCIALQYASLGRREDTISIIGFVEVDENSQRHTPIMSAFGDLREALLQINIGPPHIYLYPTKAVREMEGFHEGERVQGGHEDYDLVMRLSANGYHAVTVHKLGAVYYRRMGTMATFSEAMDRTRVAVWAASAGAIVRSGGCSPKLLTAALAGWIRHADITPAELAGPLEIAASELALLLNEAGTQLPQSEVNVLRNRLRRHFSTGARTLLRALPVLPDDNGQIFWSPQEVIDRRLGFSSISGQSDMMDWFGRALRALFRTSCRFAIYGVGEVGRYLAMLLDACDLRPVLYIDSNVISDQQLFGVPVVNLEAACTHRFDAILIASFNFQDKVRNLLREKLPQAVIIETD